MTLYMALSCLQGEQAHRAANELLSIAPGLGLQLTPGCAPEETDPATLTCPIRTHHGYTPHALRTRVWDKVGELLWKGDSVHPPLRKELQMPELWNWRALDEIVVETMYPGYAWLNSGDAIELAMSRNIRLAVDVSHLAILSRHGLLSPMQCKRIFDYDNVVEVHVSRSVGHKDSHMPLSHDCSDFGIEWAKERLIVGTPVVYEAYLHRIGMDERKRQVDVMLG